MRVDDDLLLTFDYPVATLTINRPAVRNALSLDVYERIPAMLALVENDPLVRVLIIRGTGDAAFSAGADISEFETLRADAAGARVYNAAVTSAERAIGALTKPTIAMIFGYCMGGGCGLALACDLRLADTAARFAITPARLGFVYSLESTKRLMDVVGPSTARLMLYSGRQLDSARAFSSGLVNEVHETGLLHSETVLLAREIAARAPLSVTRTKNIVYLVLNGQVADDDYSRNLRDGSFDSEDYYEGIRAFIEKRNPNFLGK